MSDPINRNGYPLSDDLRETMASALGLDIDEGWLTIALTLMEQCTVEDRGKRSWGLPAEPGPEVTHLRDASGELWHRVEHGWAPADQRWSQIGTRWSQLLYLFGPLTDATPAEEKGKGK